MISLSNADAAELLRHATERHRNMHKALGKDSSTRSINEVRRLGILLRKVECKLNGKQTKTYGKEKKI